MEVLTSNCSPASCACCPMIEYSCSSKSERNTLSLFNVILDCSILPHIQNIIDPGSNRCREERVILRRQFSTFPRSSRCALASVVIPIIAFIGVLISWLMEERKSLLARLASSASASACSNVFLAPALRSHRLCHILTHNTDHLMVPVPQSILSLLIPDLILLQIGKDKIISSWSFLQGGQACSVIQSIVQPPLPSLPERIFLNIRKPAVNAGPPGFQDLKHRLMRIQGNVPASQVNDSQHLKCIGHHIQQPLLLSLQNP